MLGPIVFSFRFFFFFGANRSGDSTARIWTIPAGHCGSASRSGPPNSVVLKHFKGRTNEKSKDVTTLDWNVSRLFIVCPRPRLPHSSVDAPFLNGSFQHDGTLLATGSYDGNARIWSREGGGVLFFSSGGQRVKTFLSFMMLALTVRHR